MNKPSDPSGSHTGVVVAIVLLLLAVPCCGGVALVGAAFLGFRAVERPAQPVVVQPLPPQSAPVVTLEEPPVAPEPPEPPEPPAPLDSTIP